MGGFKVIRSLLREIKEGRKGMGKILFGVICGGSVVGG